MISNRAQHMTVARLDSTTVSNTKAVGRSARANPRFWPAALALAIGWTSPVSAAPPEVTKTDSSTKAETDLELQEMQSLYAQGYARYSSADYEAAIEAFVKVMELMALHGGASHIRGATLFNLGSSYEKAYGISHDPADLRRARETYSRYLQEARDNGYPDTDHARDRLNAVTTKLEELEASPDEGSANEVPEKNTTRERDGQPRDRRTLALTATGATLLGLGAGMLAMMTSGLITGAAAEREGQAAINADPNASASQLQPHTRKGQTGNRLAIAGGVTGGILAATGIALVVTGQRRKRRRITITPSIARHRLGTTLSWEF